MAVVAAPLLLSSLFIGSQSAPAQAQESPGASPGSDSTTVDAIETFDPAEMTNATIVDLQDRLETAEDELEQVGEAETTAQAEAVAARTAVDEADRRVVVAAEAAQSAADDLARAESNLDHVTGLLRDASEALDDAHDRLAVTEVALADARHLLQLRVRESYKGGGQLNTASMVLRIERFNDAVHIQRMIRAVVADDNQLVADYLRLQLQRQGQLDVARAEEARVDDARTRTDRVRRERADAAEASDEAEQAARDEQAERDATLAAVEADLANLGAERLEVEERIDRLRSELEAERRAEADRRRQEAEQRRADLARRAQEARLGETERRAAEVRAEEQRRLADAARAAEGDQAADGSAATAAPPDTSRGGTGCGSTSYWVWPTAGCVNSPFGYRDHPILATRRLHAGFDIAAPAGQPIYAVAAGTVYRADFSSGGNGNVVVIDHGSVATLYAHQQRLLVSAGDRVLAGQQIGTVGSTGLSTGPHLHMQVHLDGPNGQPVDPSPWFR